MSSSTDLGGRNASLILIGEHPRFDPSRLRTAYPEAAHQSSPEEPQQVSPSFGWLDTDHSQRRRMLDVVDLFRERDTVDEIGVGPIRDTISQRAQYRRVAARSRCTERGRPPARASSCSLSGSPSAVAASTAGPDERTTTMLATASGSPSDRWCTPHSQGKQPHNGHDRLRTPLDRRDP